jgi:hypothetical protein
VISGYRKRPAPKENPEAREFALRGLLLPESHENSNSILLKIPIEMHNLGHGERLTYMDGERLPHELGLDEEAIQGLLQAGLIRRRPQKPRPKERID